MCRAQTGASFPASAVKASRVVPTHLRQFAEGMQTCQHTHFAAFGMVPANGNLRDLKAVFFGDVENLHIKPETFQPLAAEGYFRCVFVEQLEAALRVGDGQSNSDTHHGVEKASRAFTKTRLMNADQRSVESPAADRHFHAAAVDRVAELIEFLNRRRKIGVGEQTPLPPGLPHAVTDRVTLTAV